MKCVGMNFDCRNCRTNDTCSFTYGGVIIVTVVMVVENSEYTCIYTGTCMALA